MALIAGSTLPLNHFAGQRLGAFHLERLLGTGAGGAVYLARDTALQRDVAIKLIAKGSDDNDADRRVRFLREARAAAKLLHPNVVQIFQIGEATEFRYIAMEYVEGMSTAKAAKRQGGRLPEPFGIEKMREAADALRLAGSLGICHRDIKPANLLLNGAGTLKIADFGLAAQVERGESKAPGATASIEGTPFYMSPEQWSGGEVDVAADIYGFGCTFYHLLCGSTPYVQRDIVGCMQAHCTAPVPDPKMAVPEMDPILAGMIRRCMAKRPQDRPKAVDLVELLDDMLMLRRRAARAMSSQPDLAPTIAQPAPAPVDLEKVRREAAALMQESATIRRSALSHTLDQHPSTPSTTPAPPNVQRTTLEQSTGNFAAPTGGFGQESYHDLFAMRGYPFSDNRQPDFFWDGGPYSAAVRTIASQITRGQRSVLLLGPPGSGRTFACEIVRQKFARVQTFVVEPQMLFGARILVALSRQHGVNVNPAAPQRALIETFLAEALPGDRPEAIAVVVVDGVDPADVELTGELDEILRESPGNKLAVILIGSEDLPNDLALHGAPSSLYAGVQPVFLRDMTQAEMVSYIDFRMTSIGGSDRGLELDTASAQFLHARSGGNPKLVNVYCHNALTFAALKHAREVKFDMIRLGMKSKKYLTPESAQALLKA